MKAKWYISAIIFTLTLFGIANQQKNNTPNQEIVLQFTDVALTSNAAQLTIAKLKYELEAIGVDYLKFEEVERGQLKITYYSDADVASIQNRLSNKKSVALDYNLNQENKSKTPLKGPEVHYNLDVYEIQKTNDFHAGSNGKFVLESKLINDRSSSPNFDLSLSGIQIKDHRELVKVAYKVSQNICIAIGDALHSIPEVRAGPNF